jgi:hypothetical protein
MVSTTWDRSWSVCGEAAEEPSFLSCLVMNWGSRKGRGLVRWWVGRTGDTGR